MFIEMATKSAAAPQPVADLDKVPAVPMYPARVLLYTADVVQCEDGTQCPEGSGCCPGLNGVTQCCPQENVS